MSIQSMPEDCLWKQIAVTTAPIVGIYAGMRTQAGLFKRVKNQTGLQELETLKVMRQYNLCMGLNGCAYGMASLALGYVIGNFGLAGAGMGQLLISLDQWVMLDSSDSLIKLLEASLKMTK